MEVASEKQYNMNSSQLWGHNDGDARDHHRLKKRIDEEEDQEEEAANLEEQKKNETPQTAQLRLEISFRCVSNQSLTGEQ